MVTLSPSRIRLVLAVLLSAWLVLLLYHRYKPLPPGTSRAGPERMTAAVSALDRTASAVSAPQRPAAASASHRPASSVSAPQRPAAEIEFLYDLTFQRNEQAVVEQEIFDRVLSMIDEAREFVVVDMFLFNGEHGGERAYRPLAGELTHRLVRRKEAEPGFKAVLITDEINNFYGAYTSPEIHRLEEAGVEVILTRLSRLRDSNPLYSAGWRLLMSWWGTGGPGWLPHPLSSTGRKVTARAYMKVLNFKANHRKVLVTDQGCLLSSMNPHDASSRHSNIGFAARGPICGDILRAEKAVAEFSGGDTGNWPAEPVAFEPPVAGPPRASVRLLTEGKIRRELLEALDGAGPGHQVDLAMFYLSDRQVVNALVAADGRGASVRLVLDPNKDAFGRQKGGVPNRPVADELLDRSDGRIRVRWYDTRGEQFHTKLVRVARGDAVTVFGGSANLTRRNMGDFNLEADLQLFLTRDSPVAREVEDYFERIFSNRDGDYTLPYQAYANDGWVKTARYRIEESTGFCSY